MHSKVLEIMINGGFVAFPISLKMEILEALKKVLKKIFTFQHLIPVILKILTINGSMTITTD